MEVVESPAFLLPHFLPLSHITKYNVMVDKNPLNVIFCVTIEEFISAVVERPAASLQILLKFEQREANQVIWSMISARILHLYIMFILNYQEMSVLHV